MGVGCPQWQKGEGSTALVGANATCDMGVGSLHSSIVSARDAQGKDVPTWGLAWEQAFGEWTAHLESVAQRAAKPLVGVGLRKEVLPGLQLDGTWGKQGGKAVFSLGTKYTF